MKTFLFPLLVLATSSLLHAGGFGGPPPFTNGSPLPTGVDGSYQANARTNGLAGVIRFAYNNGIQTSSTTSNSYTIFSEGLVYTGPVTASITESALAGVLESQINSTFDIASSGSFNGRFDTKSPTYFFKGSGILQRLIGFPVGSGTYAFNGVTNFRFTGVRNSQAAN